MTITRSKKRQSLVALAAAAGLLLQMVWATAHYPMLLQNLGVTENGVSVRSLVICIHRAKEQRILKKLNQSRAAQTSTINQSPITRAADNEEAPLPDELCTFSIALTANDIGYSSDIYTVLSPETIGIDTNIQHHDQIAVSRSILAALGRAPPA